MAHCINVTHNVAHCSIVTHDVAHCSNVAHCINATNGVAHCINVARCGTFQYCDTMWPTAVMWHIALM